MCEWGEGGSDTSPLLLGATRRQPPVLPLPRGKSRLRSAEPGGGGRHSRALPRLSGPSLRRPAGAPARSSTARGRARLPGGGGPLVTAGKRGRRPGGELASSWPLAGVRGSGRSPGGSGGASGRRWRRLPSASGRTDGGEAEGRPVRRTGRRTDRSSHCSQCYEKNIKATIFITCPGARALKCTLVSPYPP